MFYCDDCLCILVLRFCLFYFFEGFRERWDLITEFISVSKTSKYLRVLGLCYLVGLGLPVWQKLTSNSWYSCLSLLVLGSICVSGKGLGFSGSYKKKWSLCKPDEKWVFALGLSCWFWFVCVCETMCVRGRRSCCHPPECKRGSWPSVTLPSQLEQVPCFVSFYSD